MRRFAYLLQLPVVLFGLRLTACWNLRRLSTQIGMLHAGFSGETRAFPLTTGHQGRPRGGRLFHHGHELVLNPLPTSYAAGLPHAMEQKTLLALAFA
jgi:hypothetical protein